MAKLVALLIHFTEVLHSLAGHPDRVFLSPSDEDPGHISVGFHTPFNLLLSNHAIWSEVMTALPNKLNKLR
jgi:hypothetical protein